MKIKYFEFCRKRRLTVLLLSCLVLNACAVDSSTEILTNCDYQAINGLGFVFREQSPSLHEYGYLNWKESTKDFAERLSYEGYAGKRGKLLYKTAPGFPKAYLVAITEACQSIYTERYEQIEYLVDGRKVEDVSRAESISSPRRTQIDLKSIERIGDSLYFLDTYEQAKKLIGKKIWLKALHDDEKVRVLFTSKEGITYQRNTDEEVGVIAIDTFSYGHVRGRPVPFNLVIKLPSGDEALLPYSSLQFYYKEMKSKAKP